MKIIRHASLAVLVLVVVTVMLIPTIATAPEIVAPPSSVTVYSGNTAEFTCHTRNNHYVYWKLNGKILNRYNGTLPPRIDVDTNQETFTSDQTNYILTIRARPKYHGLVFQCVAGVGGGGPEVESKNATLMVQGLLDPVSDVRVESGNGSIFLSWRPPYSLNVTGVEPDIWYHIIITNITDDMLYISDCHKLTQPHYTFTTTNPSPCHKYNITIISLNGAGKGGRSEPVEAFLFDALNGTQVEVQRKRINSGQIFKMKLPESSCPGSKPDEYILYFMSMNRKCGIYKTERLKALNSFLNFTVSNTELPSNCSYNGIAEAINKFGSVNSTEFDVNKSPIEGANPDTTPTTDYAPASSNGIQLLLAIVGTIIGTILLLFLFVTFIVTYYMYVLKKKGNLAGKYDFKRCVHLMAEGIISSKPKRKPNILPKSTQSAEKHTQCPTIRYPDIPSPDITSQDPVTSPNELYELRKPVKCQGNQAYETVSAQALPSAVEGESIAQEVQVPHVYEEIIL